MKSSSHLAPKTTPPSFNTFSAKMGNIPPEALFCAVRLSPLRAAYALIGSLSASSAAFFLSSFCEIMGQTFSHRWQSTQRF